ncbi:uncharacterized protein AC631_00752 [Debaryomyces fabryi]|uniref:Uncharacterized protein n=1 Tax=Debaryomyces fabryi TaxID=58627 RepID=A0A0V1Q4V0_9ASCO|nr:uncharacterized protein AC631_00752 [Debaryomyces fabryi]KSA03436.1 hypothetical protein AC631_00752 [Debaryomyces fabryi]CUM53708.1 unnamed protein product [Debaryomyces fabryi]
MNATKGDSITATIYQACNDEFRKGVVIDQSKLKNSSHSVSIKDNQLDLVIDKDASDIDEIFKNHGTAIPADEILQSLNTTRVKIPIKYREEFPSDINLPDPELLNVLHYYTSKKIAKSDSYKKVERSLDETSLLAFGMMVESWADELIDESAAQMFLEQDDMVYDVIGDGEDSSLESLESGSSSSSTDSSIDTDTDLD